jgi:hypothetical protein
MVFIGYDLNTKGYRMFDPKTKQVVVTRDAVFDEEKKWDWTDSSATESKPAKDIFTVLYFPVAVSSDAAHQRIEEEMLYPNMASLRIHLLVATEQMDSALEMLKLQCRFLLSRGHPNSSIQRHQKWDQEGNET